jgi:hypothetical protein
LTYLGFITERKLAAIFITPSLGVPNWPVIYIINIEPPVRQQHQHSSPTSSRRGREGRRRTTGKKLGSAARRGNS